MLLSINGALFSGLDSFPFQIPAAFLDIRYDQAYMSLDQKLESVQYNALCLFRYNCAIQGKN